MPLLLSRSDLAPLASDDDALDRAIDLVEASIVQSHAGDQGQAVFAGLTLSNGDELATQIITTAAGPASLRLFPNRVEQTRRNAWLGVQVDGRTSEITGMIALDDLNVLRTSVPAAVGARHLAPVDAGILTVLGSSVQARSHARTISRVLPDLREIRVWSPTAPNREAFGAHLSARMSADVRVVVSTTVESALAGADVITAAGRYSFGQPAVPDPGLVRPGALLISMTGAGFNLLKAGARLAVPTFRRPELVAFGFASDFLSDTPPPSPSDALEMADVIAGTATARQSPSETVVFELAAPYVWDVPIMAWISEWATRRGIGTTFDFSA